MLIDSYGWIEYFADGPMIEKLLAELRGGSTQGTDGRSITPANAQP
jgi:hypothetical protein